MCEDCKKKDERIRVLQEQVKLLADMNISLVNQGQVLATRNKRLCEALSSNGFAANNESAFIQ